MTPCRSLVSLLTTVTIIAMLNSSVAQAQGPDAPPSDNARPIDLAIVGPMVGTSFYVGMQFIAGVNAAISTLTDGTLLGRPVRITEYDDRCRQAIAEKLSLEIVQQPPHVIIGHSCSATTIAAAPVYAAHDILQITPSSTAPAVTEMGISSIFRMIGRDDAQGQMAADWLATHHSGEKLGFFRSFNDYSMGLTNSAIAELSNHGIEPTLVVQSAASATSYLNEIMQFMAADIDVVYLVGGALDSGVFVRQARQVAAPFNIISSDTLVSSIFMETAGAAADGIPFTSPADVTRLADEDLNGSAVAAIKSLGFDAEGYTLLAYAATEVWLAGVRRAQSLQAEAVANAIRAEPLNTVLGTISFEANGDISTPYPAFSWFNWQAGQRVPLD